MKILLLNPHVNAQHKIQMALQAAGHVVLSGASSDEAWKILQAHGSTMDLAVIHREQQGVANSDYGTKLIERIKEDAKHADLPIILTSEVWDETLFFQHQQGKFGANAYLHWPFDEDQLIQVIQSMFGGVKPVDTAENAKPVSDSNLTANTGLFVVLEESTKASGLIAPDQAQLDKTGFNIVLDPPVVESTLTATATATATSTASNAAQSVAPPGFTAVSAPSISTASTPEHTSGISLEMPPVEKSAVFKGPSSAGEIDLPEASKVVELALTGTSIPAPPHVKPEVRSEVKDLKFDEGISLDVGNVPKDGTSLTIDPPSEATFNKTLTQAPSEPALGELGGVPKLDPPKGTSSLTLGALMNEDLEPHERLEIMRKLKSKQAAAAPKENNTMVLDTVELGLKKESKESSKTEDKPLDLVPDPTASIVGSATSPGSEPEPFPVSSLQLTPPPSKTPKTNAIAMRQEPARDEPVFEAQLSPNDPSGDDVPGELSYLFEKKSPALPGTHQSSAFAFVEPVGDAVVPGGVSHAPDVETLKKYLMLREQDVAILSNQLKSAREQVALLDRNIKEEKSKSESFERISDDQNKRIEEFEKEKALALQGLQSEIDELKLQNKSKVDKARALESQVKDATDEIEKLKGRVRSDIRKIRVREKELENKLEIVKKDSEALISTREARIMELKRKIDLLEFNMDLLQDQLSREKETSAQLRERLGRAAQVVRVAGGLLDSPNKNALPSALNDTMSASDGVDQKKQAREAS